MLKKMIGPKILPDANDVDINGSETGITTNNKWSEAAPFPIAWEAGPAAGTAWSSSSCSPCLPPSEIDTVLGVRWIEEEGTKTLIGDPKHQDRGITYPKARIGGHRRVVSRDRNYHQRRIRVFGEIIREVGQVGVTTIPIHIYITRVISKSF